MIGSKNNYSIKKSNFAIEITNNLTSLQRKFYNHILFEQEQQGWNKPIIQIRISDINYLIGNNDRHRQNHNKIKSTLKQLLTKQLTLNNVKYEGYEATCFLSYIKIEAGYIEVKIDDELKKYLNINYVNSQGIKNTSKGYTSLDLNIINCLKSTYHIALYEFLTKIFNEQKQKKHIEIDLNILRKIATNRQSYDKYKEFQRSVLKPAIDAINVLTDLNVSYEQLKYANKVESIVFNIERKVIEDIDCIKKCVVKHIDIVESKKTLLLPDELEDVASWGYSNIKQLLAMYNEDETKQYQLLAILATINLKYGSKTNTEKCKLLSSLINKNAHADTKALYDAKTSKVEQEVIVQKKEIEQARLESIKQDAIKQKTDEMFSKIGQIYDDLIVSEKENVFRKAVKSAGLNISQYIDRIAFKFEEQTVFVKFSICELLNG